MTAEEIEENNGLVQKKQQDIGAGFIKAGLQRPLGSYKIWGWIDAINPTIGIDLSIEHVIDRDLLQFQYERTLQKHGIPLVPYSERHEWRPPNEPRVNIYIEGKVTSANGLVYLDIPGI
jgi:hypothetical protein